MSTDFKPQIPPLVRTVVYAVGLAWGTLATLVTGIAAVWWPDHAQAILATVGAGSSAVAFLAGGLGVAYRPTAGHGTGVESVYVNIEPRIGNLAPINVVDDPDA